MNDLVSYFCGSGIALSFKFVNLRFMKGDKGITKGAGGVLGFIFLPPYFPPALFLDYIFFLFEHHPNLIYPVYEFTPFLSLLQINMSSQLI